MVFNPSWLEVFLVRALDHDNDSVQKFVLGKLMSRSSGCDDSVLQVESYGYVSNNETQTLAGWMGHPCF